jgi:ribose transport system permease protein
MTTIAVSLRQRSLKVDSTTTVYLALVGLLIIGSIIVGTRGEVLLDQAGILKILTGCTALGLVAIGQTIAVVSGSLDLSVAYLIGLCSLVTAEVMAGQGSMMLPAVLAALGVAAVVGLVNGLVITRLRVNAFIATLGMALILKGLLESRYTGPAGSTTKTFQRLGYDRIGPVPVSFLLLLAVAGGAWWFLARTRPGYHLYAVGGDIESARVSGVRTSRTIVLAHVLCSLAAGATGVFLASRLGSGAPYVGTDAGYDLQSIAAVVLGGTVLAGGRGGVAGTVGGVLILSVLDTVFDDLGVNSFFKDVVRGVIIIVAVALYARGRLARRRPRPTSGAQAGVQL